MTKSGRNCLPIICNPAAGAGKAKNLWADFENLLKSHSVQYKVIFTEFPSHAVHLADKLCKEKTKAIGVFGGDGTLNEVIQGVMSNGTCADDRPSLIFFPGGSSCDFRKFLPVKRDNLEIILNPDPWYFDLGYIRCRDADGNPVERYFVNNSSIGVISESIQRFNQATGFLKKLKGLNVDLAAVTAGVSAIMGWKPLDCRMTIDESDLNIHSISNCTVLKNPFFGGGMHFKCEGTIDDGLLNIVIVEGRTRLQLATTIPSLYTGTTLNKKGVYQMRCQSVLIDSTSQIPVETDGEIAGFPPVSYTVLPKAIKINL